MRPAFFAMIALVSFPVAARASAQEDQIGAAVAALKNWDVTWSGNYFGLAPYLSERAEAVRSHGDAARPALLSALESDDSFVVAHVLLTEISARSHQISGSHWNLLRVELFADGSTTIDPKQRKRLLEFWKREAIKLAEATPKEPAENREP